MVYISPKAFVREHTRLIDILRTGSRAAQRNEADDQAKELRDTMPSKSKSQQRLMAAAEHGAQFAKAKALRKSMTREQLHEFAEGEMKGKPERVRKMRDVQSSVAGRDRSHRKRGW